MPRTLLAVLLLLAPALAGADVLVSDPLTDPSSSGLGVRGGSFSPSGWTTASSTDTLWFTIATPLESGSMSFDVTGIGECGPSCLGDLDLFTLYQQPDGLSQPIDYTPGYRNNDQRVFVRMFQTGPGQPEDGALKMELAGCTVVPPYYNNTCPASCSALDGIAYCGGAANDCGWDASHTYHFELDWGGGTMSYSRDGVVLGAFGYPSTFAPSPLVAQLGSPRNGQAGGSGMPPGLTFTNLLVTGTPGAQTPACNAGTAPVDAGRVDAPCTDGSIGDTADVTAASWSSAADPDPTDLNVEGDGSGNPSAIVYLAFPPPSGPVQQATLALHTAPFSSAAGGSGVVCLVSPGVWDESTLTWSSRPAVTSTCAGTARPVTPDEEVAWDVTALLQADPNASLAIVSTDGDGAHYLSRESGGCAQGPRLQLVLGAVTTTTTSSTSSGATSTSGTTGSGTSTTGTSGTGSTSGSSSSSTSTGSSSGASTSGSSGPSAKPPAITSSGCGCTSSGDAGAFAALLALIGLARVAGRRRN